MKTKSLTIVALLILSMTAGAAASIYEENAPIVIQPFFHVSPLRMIPFVSHKQSRKNICALDAGGLIEKVCNKKYDNVKAKDTKKIDELFEVLNEIKDNTSISEKAKYLTAQLIFSTLPSGSASIKKSMSDFFKTSVLDTNLLAQENGASFGISRSDYINQMQSDFDAVKSNCPQAGSENWVLSAMCSEYKWVNGERQPIYSKQYAESGGPCKGDAGGIEETKIQSIINSKMRSEYDFTNEKGISSQIACSFTCASYKCPKLEQSEIERTQCKNPIYYPFYGKNKVEDLTLKDKTIAFNSAKDDCFERGNDYTTRPDGTSTFKKARNCKLTWNSDTTYFDPQFGRSVPVRTYCCSCARTIQDPYVSIYDFNQPGYKGDDWFKKIIDVVKNKEEKKEVKVDRLRFTCSVTKKRDSSGVLDLHLDGKTEWVDTDGKPAYASYYGIPNGGGIAAIGKSCISSTDEVPVCIDPRTNKPTDSPLDFTMEYIPTAGRTADIIGQESNQWFWTMGNSLRKCETSELPPESYFR